MKKPLILGFCLLTLGIFIVACGGGGGGGGEAGVAPVSSTDGTGQGVVRGRIQGSGDLTGISVYLIPEDSESPPVIRTIKASFRQSVDAGFYATQTNPGGEFSFSNVAAGGYNLIAQQDRFHSSLVKNVRVQGIMAEIVDLSEIILTATGDISGTVTVDGTARLGVAVFIKGTSFSAFSDEAGKFVITGVPAPQNGVSSYTIYAYFPGFKQESFPQVLVKAGVPTPLTSTLSLIRDEAFFVGLSFVWKGNFPSEAAVATQFGTPQKNWAYFDTTERKVKIFNGTGWEIFLEGIQGPTGTSGATGSAGISIVWKGSFATEPASPELNWAYYNTTDKKSYIWNGTAWDILSESLVGTPGPAGTAGVSIVWKGNLSTAPASPQLNWAYYNSTDKQAYLYNGTSWVVFLPYNPNGDTTAPTILNVQNAILTANSLRITWTTNEHSTSQIEYGTTTTYGALTTLDDYYVQSHQVDLTSLAQNTVYHFRVRSKDAAGNEGISPDLTFSISSVLVSSVTTAGNRANITINYNLSSVVPSSIQVQYSTDSGTTWVTTSNVSGDLSGVSAGARSITWPSHLDFTDLQNTVKVRLVANDGVSNSPPGDSAIFAVNNRSEVSNVLVAGARGPISITYDTVSSINSNIAVYYSLNGGTSWTPTTNLVGATTGVTTGAGHTLTWNSHQDFLDQQANVKLKVVVDEGVMTPVPAESAVFAVDNRSIVSNVQVTGANTIAITYDLNASVNANIQVFYSINGGTTYTQTTNLTGTTSNIAAGAGQTITWNSYLDFGTQQGTVKVKVVPDGATVNVFGESSVFAIDNRSVVSNVVAALVSGVGGPATLSFDLAAPINTDIQVAYSLDGGTTFTNTSNVTGTVTNLAPGSGQTLTWNSQMDALATSTPAIVKIRVTASGGITQSVPGVSNAFALNNIGYRWVQTTAAAPFGPRSGHTVVSYNSKLWLIGGGTGVYSGSGGGFIGNTQKDVWSSPDGITWTQETAAAAFPDRMCHTCLVFNSKLWVIAGISKDTGEYSSPVYRNDVWSSLDGITWTVATTTAAFQARGGHSSVVFGGKMWVIGGTTSYAAYKNDVWSSADGIAWTQETGAAAFSARMNHASLVAQSKIWVVGGDNGGTLSDVWSSPDGITWSSVSGSAEFGARGSPIAFDYDNRLWILGGNSRTDAWYSGNGSFWTKVDPDPGFGNAQLTNSAWSPTMRLYSGAAGTVHNGKMFEVGGDSLGDDVWYSQ